MRMADAVRYRDGLIIALLAFVPLRRTFGMSGTRIGWTAGAGLEWMFCPGWSTSIEYLHYDLGSAS